MSCCIDDGGFWGQCVKYSEECLRFQAQRDQEFMQGLGIAAMIVLVIIFAILIAVVWRTKK